MKTMIKRFIFLLLLIVCVVLSYMLYNQYRVLPDRPLREARDLIPPEKIEREMAQARSPLPPPKQEQERPQPKKPEPAVEPAESSAGSEPAPEVTAAPKPTPGPQVTEKESTPAPPAQEPREAPGKPVVDSKFPGKAISLAPPPPLKLPRPHSATEHEPGESRAQKMLEKAEKWVEKEVEKAEGLGKVETQEVEQEKKIAGDMDLSRQEVTRPKSRVDELVRQIEQRSLGTPKPDTVREPIVKPAKVYELDPEPKDEPKAATAHNRVVSIELIIENKNILLDIRTESPVERHKYFQISNPRRLVIDLYGKFMRSRPKLTVPKNVMISDVRTGIHPDKLRIVADLLPDADISISVESRAPTQLMAIMRPGS